MKKKKKRSIHERDTYPCSEKACGKSALFGKQLPCLFQSLGDTLYCI